jgi:hypothetical protein
MPPYRVSIWIVVVLEATSLTFPRRCLVQEFTSRFRRNQRKRKLVKRYRRALAFICGAGTGLDGSCYGLAPLRGRPGGPWAGLAVGMVNSRAEAMVSRDAVRGARDPGLLALRSASGLGLSADAGRHAPTAFNRAGEKLRAGRGRAAQGFRRGWSPTSWRARSPPSAGERSWAPMAGAAGWRYWSGCLRRAAGGVPAGAAGGRSQRPSWWRERPWSRSSAARRQRTPPGPWRVAYGLRPRPR